VASASRAIATSHPSPGQAEQDPETWVDAAAACVRDACLGAGFRSVDAVGLTGQSDTLVVVGPNGRASRPALLWMDARGAAEAARFEAAMGRGTIHERTGLRSSANYTAPKAAWVRRVERRLFDRAQWLLQPKDYLHLRLTGASATDPSSASRTLLYDLRSQSWWPDALEGFGIPARLLPPIVASASGEHVLVRASATALGLAAGTPVIVGAADRAAEALGLGISASTAMVSTGTATGVALAFPRANRVTDDRVTTPCHALPHESLALLSIPTSGAILDWLARLTAGRERHPVRSLLRDASGSSPGARGVVAVPTFAGARSFRWEARARGAIMGLELGTTRGDLARAVVEAIAFEVSACVAVLREAVGPLDRLFLTGGGHTDPFVCQLMADVTGLPAVAFGDRDAALAGAMLLAGAGVGAWQDARATAAGRLGRRTLFEPDPILHETYRGLAGRYEAAVGAALSVDLTDPTASGRLTDDGGPGVDAESECRLPGVWRKLGKSWWRNPLRESGGDA
jgi:xylulokinase